MGSKNKGDIHNGRGVGNNTAEFKRKSEDAHHFPYDVKLRLLAHSRSFLANQKARNAIVGAENLLNFNIHILESVKSLFFKNL